MRFRKIVSVLLVCMALGALAANAAQAGQWTVGTEENQVTAGTKISLESVVCKKHGTTELAFTSKVLGAALKLTASGADCVNATIDTTEKGVDHGAGTFKLTGVSVVEPKDCSVGGASHELTTSALTSESTASGTRYFPESGTFITLTFEGPLCPIAEVSAPIKGVGCGELVHTNPAGTGFEPNKPGTLTKVRTILAKSGTGCALTLGTQTAQISGAGDSELSGASAGKPWGAD